jgi:ankyrin repeat protein
MAVVRLSLDTDNVDIDSADQNGQTPFSLAAQSVHMAIFKLLLNTDEIDYGLTEEHGPDTLLLATEEADLLLLSDWCKREQRSMLHQQKLEAEQDCRRR